MKYAKAIAAKNKLKLNSMYMNNYDMHDNGRIWFYWNDEKVGVRDIVSTDQMIQCGVYVLCFTV